MCQVPASLMIRLSNRTVAVSIIKWKVTFLGQGQRKTSTHKAGKSLNFVPHTLLQLLIVKDTVSYSDFCKSFPPVYIWVVQDAEPCSYKGKGEGKGGWYEMLEGEQKDYKRQQVVKGPASKHHFHVT